MTTQQIEFVEKFVKQHGSGLAPHEREDLRQDIFVALLQYWRTDEELDITRFVAEACLACFRDQRRAMSMPAGRCAPSTIDLSFLTFDSSIDLKAAVGILPSGLKSIAVDLFYNDLTQREVAFKQHRSQPWVAECRKEIVRLMYNYLTNEREEVHASKVE